MEFKEAQLFFPLKQHFKQLGYKVYAEVPCFYRGVDFVAVDGQDHIAVEMKMSFNAKVVSQAHDNILSFGKSYIAYPVKKAVMFHSDDVYWKLRNGTRTLYDHCAQIGIGILQIVGEHKIIFEALEAKYQKPYRVFDFSQYVENDDDKAGLPFQKGVSAGYMELRAIKEYVREHPRANWVEIYQNVQNHYSGPASLSGSMSQWRGFSLKEFKNQLAIERLAERGVNVPTSTYPEKMN